MLPIKKYVSSLWALSDISSDQLNLVIHLQPAGPRLVNLLHATSNFTPDSLSNGQQVSK